MLKDWVRGELILDVLTIDCSEGVGEIQLESGVIGVLLYCHLKNVGEVVDGVAVFDGVLIWEMNDWRCLENE